MGRVMKTLKEQIAVMQAEDEGEQIEIQPLDGSYPCEDKIYQAYNWNRNDYRVKPNPMEIWLNIYPDREILQSHRNTRYYYTKEEATRDTFKDLIKTIKFIQAPDDEQE